jgi:anti-sigma regulatory factor (Ser/Thr protein kinase)
MGKRVRVDDVPTVEAPGQSGDQVSVRLRVPAELDSLGEVRETVRDVLERTDWDEERPAEVLLAVTEAVGNAIEHGSLPGKPVHVEITVTDGGASVRVTDEGRPGARLPSGDPVPPPAESTRGRGRVIMRALADRFEVTPAGAGTAVRLEFSSG